MLMIYTSTVCKSKKKKNKKENIVDIWSYLNPVILCLCFMTFYLAICSLPLSKLNQSLVYVYITKNVAWGRQMQHNFQTTFIFLLFSIESSILFVTSCCNLFPDFKPQKNSIETHCTLVYFSLFSGITL